jgi:hypothetical protein
MAISRETGNVAAQFKDIVPSHQVDSETSFQHTV